MTKNIAPNFLIVGAAKSGTTSLYNYISRHPNIYMSPVKEPMFFVSNIYTKLSRDDPRHQIADEMVVSDFNDYLKLFDKAKIEETALGEASVAYLYHYSTAIPLIKKYIGDIKIIILLRNPVERAYSAYTHLVRDGVESTDFEDFLKEEDHRKKDNWDILNYPQSLGLYYSQVKAYMDAFTEVKVILFDDLKRNPDKIVEETFGFLGVDTSYKIDINSNITKVFNRSSVPKNNLLQRFMIKQPPLIQYAKSALKIFLPAELWVKIKTGLYEKNQIHPEPVNAVTRRQLERFFKEDILKTQELIQQDLSSWVTD